jgi:CPA1 family monovalent cation:H+ antiporter
MQKHWISVAIFLLPVMTAGWLVVGLFIWALIPHFSFSDGLLVSACVTATDPVLAAAVVGKGKFAERVPGHLRNLLSAESGCNDGMAFPFIFLSLNIVLYPGNAREIVKNWFLLTILWECLFGCLLGAVLGFSLRKIVEFAELKKLIDRESFLALFVFLALMSAGFGSMLGVDDLLVSFAAGTAFGWNGEFAKKTEESNVSTVIDLLLNLSFFVYFGAIVPWPQFNNSSLGLDVWRLIVLAIVIVFLRRIPAVMMLKPFTPDVKSWREALFCGHFGPIGVGAIFAAILARKDLEAHYTTEETPLAHLPDESFPHYQLLTTIWPIVTFIVITSIVVHGSSVAVLTLGKRLNRMAITMTFTTTNTQDGGPQWMQRLQKLEKVSTSFSLHRVDTKAPPEFEEKHEDSNNKIETSGVKVRPAGGAKRRKHKKKKKNATATRIKKTLSRVGTNGEEEFQERQRPQAQFLQLGRDTSQSVGASQDSQDSTESPTTKVSQDFVDEKAHQETSTPGAEVPGNEGQIPTTMYQDGKRIVVEDQHGEVVETVQINDGCSLKSTMSPRSKSEQSIHSMESLARKLSQYSEVSNKEDSTTSSKIPMVNDLKKLTRSISNRTAYIKKDDPKRKVFAHQIDDLILIENDEGEIIRKYHVNRHVSNRARSESIVSKALSYVGIKAGDSKNATPNINITPDQDKPQDLQNTLKQTLRGDGKREPTHLSSNMEESEEEDVSADSEVSDETDAEYDDSDMEETAVERERRLNALGKLPKDRIESDEEP